MVILPYGEKRKMNTRFYFFQVPVICCVDISMIGRFRIRTFNTAKAL